MEDVMLKNKWAVCFLLMGMLVHWRLYAQDPNFGSPKGAALSTPSMRINDLLNNDLGSKSSGASKAESILPAAVEPSLPGQSPLAQARGLNGLENFADPMASFNKSNQIDLVGIYYAKSSQRAEISIGGISQYYSEGDRLSSQWVLKSIEPSRIELQRCKDKSKQCESKIIAFNSSIRE